MKFIVTAHSDTGIKKQMNQDSLCVKVADTKKGQIVLGVICDGMGGLKKGELASAEVIRTFSSWFETVLPTLIEKKELFQLVKEQWVDLIEALNKKILIYGAKNSMTLGTTLTAILIVENTYILVNVGDSRIYVLNNSIIQLTTDQTLIEKELKQKRITREKAVDDPRKNILLQCIGASQILEPEFREGKVVPKEVYLLCSDGFRHQLKEEEMLGVLSPIVLSNHAIMKDSLIDLVELNKTRGETDNISAVLIKCE